jgi:hypothetical protein
MFVRAKTRERERARTLRREGLSLREIAWRLEVSLSSVSIWVRDIPRDPPGEPPPTASPDPEPCPEEVLRWCGKCKQHLPESSFNRHPSGRQWWCRDCYRAYFRQRGDVHRQQSGNAKKRRQREARRSVAAYLAHQACFDCGLDESALLEFDHVGFKRADVSALIARGSSVAALRREVSQCEIVCVNCHRRRTAQRGAWRRAVSPWWKAAPPRRYETARNLAYVYSRLELSACVDCGEEDIVVLDFDHVGPKRGNVVELARSGVGLARLQAELDSCVIRCANCHRLRHVADRRVRIAGA